MAGKELKFDIKLMTGTFERNFKRCTIGLMKGWRDFGQNMKKSNSFLEASNAVYMFGKKGVESITALFHPYEALVGKIVAVGYAVKKACAEFEQFEKAGLKASYAFKGRGGTHDFDKFKSKVLTATEGGVGNATEVMGAVADARQEAPSLNNKELEFAIDMSKELAAIQGGDMASAVGTITDLLHKEDVTIEELSKAGLNLNQIEWQKIKALNGVWNQHKRNNEIMKLYTKHLKGASQEEAKTLAGMYKRMVNILDNLKMKLGQALAPIVKPFFQLAVVIMNIAEGFVKPFSEAAKVIGAVFSPLTKLLTNCAGLCRVIGALLGTVVMIMLPLWIKHQTAILLLWIKQQAMVLLNARNTNVFLKSFLKTMTQIVAVQGVALRQNLFGVMKAGAVAVRSALVGIFAQLKLIGVSTIANIKAANGWLLVQLAIMKKIVWEKTKAGAANLWSGMKALPGQISRGVTSAGRGIAKGWTKLSGGKGILGAMGNIGTGMLAGGKGFLNIIKVFGRAIVGFGRFAGPLAIVATLVGSVVSYLKGFAKGWVDSFNKASGSSASLMDILKRVGKIIISIVNIILFPFKLIFKLFEKLGYLMGWLGGKIGAILLPIIEKTVGALEKAKNAVADKAKEAYFWAKEKLGFDTSAERAEWERQKAERDNPKGKEGGDTDPRMEFDSAFESAASMNQRIQTSIMKKTATDPHARIADYLSEIKEMVKGLRSGQEQQVENSKNGTKAQQETNKKLSNLEPGLA
ncbi:MAG: hypothetical protein IJG38_02455 [Thermoguttaceae bacterium]|nr:hypothetical protein [Thermoguttaceae bacterium]